jgi:hypothetical protein
MVLSLVDALIGGLPPPLRIGMSAEELLNELGATEFVVPRSRRDRRPAILKYGDLEFHFGDDGLDRMFSDTFTIPTGTDRLIVEAAWVRRSLLIEEARRHVAALNITYRTVDDRWNPGHVDLFVGTHSVLKFRVAAVHQELPGLEAFMVEAPASSAASAP